EVDLDKRRTRTDAALNKRLRQWVLNIALEGATQRTRAVAAVYKGLIQHPLRGFISHGDGDVTLSQIGIELLHQQFENLDQVGISQRVEDDHFIQPVQELRIECPLHFLANHLLNLFRDQLLLIYLEA